MGTEPVAADDRRSAIAEFCRDIETYLCRKNDGHLIRVTGPSFDLVSGWAKHGVPLKVAYAGIDRYFERYYRKGPRRRPVKIDFCEADVLDAFDEWRRAIGLGMQPANSQSPGLDTPTPSPQSSSPQVPSRQSLSAHLERAVLRLSDARARGLLGPEFDPLIDRASAELDLARSQPNGLRGASRQAMVDRLGALQADVMAQAHGTLDDATRAALIHEAETSLAPFRAAMPAEVWIRARQNAVDALVRERLQLPQIAY